MQLNWPVVLDAYREAVASRGAVVRRAAAATETAVTSSPSIRRPLLGAAVSNTPPSSAAAAGRVCPPLVSPSPAGRAVGLPPALSPAGLPPSPACGGPPAVLPLSALLAAVGRLLPLPQEAALSPSQLDEGVAREQLLVNLSATAVLQAAAAKICRFGGGGPPPGGQGMDLGAWGSPNLTYSSAHTSSLPSVPQ